jgi:hypothetical protein
MATPASDPNESSKMKKLMSGNADDSMHSRLPPSNGANRSRPVSTPPTPPTVYPAPAPEPRRWRFKFLPAFWTIASILSLTVNIILIIALLIAYQMLDRILGLQTYGVGQASGLLGGLYTNFVKMDQATIATTIPVDAVIPLNIEVPVQKTTQITLADTAVIPNAHVRINTGELSINANAVVTLPAGTPLTVSLDFPLTVQNSIPIHLDVPVNIPLNQTELHEPFVGLQQVVRPWYCLIEPNALLEGVQVCSQETQGTTEMLPTPTPVGTVIP